MGSCEPFKPYARGRMATTNTTGVSGMKHHTIGYHVILLVGGILRSIGAFIIHFITDDSLILACPAVRFHCAKVYIRYGESHIEITLKKLVSCFAHVFK